MLSELVKAVGHSSGGHGGGILGFAKKVLKEASGGQKFSGTDVKRVYFVSGNLAMYTAAR